MCSVYCTIIVVPTEAFVKVLGGPQAASRGPEGPHPARPHRPSALSQGRQAAGEGRVAVRTRPAGQPAEETTLPHPIASQQLPHTRHGSFAYIPGQMKRHSFSHHFRTTIYAS